MCMYIYIHVIFVDPYAFDRNHDHHVNSVQNLYYISFHDAWLVRSQLGTFLNLLL